MVPSVRVRELRCFKVVLDRGRAPDGVQLLVLHDDGFVLVFAIVGRRIRLRLTVDRSDYWRVAELFLTVLAVNHLVTRRRRSLVEVDLQVVVYRSLVFARLTVGCLSFIGNIVLFADRSFLRRMLEFLGRAVRSNQVLELRVTDLRSNLFRRIHAVGLWWLLSVGCRSHLDARVGVKRLFVGLRGVCSAKRLELRDKLVILLLDALFLALREVVRVVGPRVDNELIRLLQADDRPDLLLVDA